MHPDILKKLRAYRNTIRRAVGVEGLCYAAAALVLLVFVSLAIDYFRHLSTSGRVFSLLVGLGALGYVLHRTLLSRLARPMDVERMALTVEDRFPELRDRLISCLQFAPVLQTGDTGRSDQSLEMMAAVSSDAVAAVAPLDLGRTIDRGRLARALAVALLALLAVIAMCFVTDQGQNVMWLWFQRNIAMSSVRWPQRTHLAVAYPTVIPRGDPLTVDVTSRGEEPEEVTVRYRFTESGTKGEQKCSFVGEEGQDKFSTRFKSVGEPMEFWVYGNDAAEGPFLVSLVERPNITQLKFWAVYPTYTRRPPQVLKAGESFLEVLPGTTIWVAAAVNKELDISRPESSGAAMYRDDEQAGIAMHRIYPPLPAAAQQKTLDALGLPPGDNRLSKDWWVQDAHWQDAKELWMAPIEVATDGAVAVRVRDTYGLDNRPPTRFTVRVIADREPTVVLKMTGIGQMVVTSVTIPLEIKATDDYTVAGLGLVHRLMVEEKYLDEETIPYRIVPGKEVVHKVNWKPVGLVVGSVLTFRAQATDEKDVEPKNIGKTETTSVRVVTPEELQADLVRRQLEQHQDFKRVRDRQELEIGPELNEAVRLAGAGAKPDDKQRAELAATEQTIRDSAEEIIRVADALHQVVLEMANNNIGDDKQRNELQKEIIDRSRRIAQALLPQQAEGLKSVLAGGGALNEAQCATAVAQNKNALAEMDLVLSHMVKLETYRAIVDQARKIREEQEKLFTDIERERKLLLKSILGDRVEDDNRK